jgi:predicted SnoaL-like aldol condensation-catalyzing enzyme
MPENSGGERDTVSLHSRYLMVGKAWRFIDIYRLQNDKFVEHWDAMIQWPEEQANDNQIF